VDAGALVVGAIGLAMILAVGRVSFLRGDDWVILSIINEPGFSVLDVFKPYGSHLMPLGLSAFWSSRAMFGATPWWPLLSVGITFVVIAWLFTWLTIRLVVRPQLPALLPFAVAAWAPSALAAVMWPSPSVYMTPLWAATAAALYVYVRGRLGMGPRHWPLWVVAVVALGLLALETALLIGPMLFVVEAAWFTRGGLVASVRRAWHTQRTLWLLLIAMAAVYLAVYFALADYSQTLPQQRAGVDLLIEGLVTVWWKILPSMVLAGTWVWEAAMAPRNAVGLWLSLLVAAIGWLVIVRGRRSGVRAWWPVVAMLLLTVGALSAARLAAFGPAVLLNPYYYLGSLGLLAVTLAIGYLPGRSEADSESPVLHVVPLAVIALLLLASATVSAVGYADVVPAAPSRGYLTQAAISLQQTTLNTASPRNVFGVFSYQPPFDTAANTLAFAGVAGNWVRAGEQPEMLNDAGDRVPLSVEGVDVDLRSPCEAIVGPTSLAMPETRDPNWPTFAMTYRSDTDQSAWVDFEGESIEVPVRGGEHTVYFTGPAVAPSLVIRGEGLCLRALTVGAAVPAVP
jgi:hypothetical protein